MRKMLSDVVMDDFLIKIRSGFFMPKRPHVLHTSSGKTRDKCTEGRSSNS